MGVSMSDLYKETYKIDGYVIIAIANFKTDTLTIQRQGHALQYTLNEYENFNGNMQDFIKSKFLEQKE